MTSHPGLRMLLPKRVVNTRGFQGMGQRSKGKTMIRRTLVVTLFSCSLLGFQLPSRAPLEALKSRIESVTRSINARWGLYIKSLETGEEIAINADEQMDTMSTIKIPLMVEVYRQAREGKFKLTDMHTM